MSELLDLDAIRAAPPMKIWFCKVGEVADELLPPGSDLPMREAVERAYHEVTGQEAMFTFSGWGGSLTEGERACVENRLPDFDLIASEDPETLRAEVTALRAELDAARATALAEVDRALRSTHRWNSWLKANPDNGLGRTWAFIAANYVRDVLQEATDDAA